MPRQHDQRITVYLDLVLHTLQDSVRGSSYIQDLHTEVDLDPELNSCFLFRLTDPNLRYLDTKPLARIDK
jgi:hypothetical protein